MHLSGVLCLRDFAMTISESFEVVMNAVGNGDGVDDDLTVSQGCYLLEEAHKCIMEALSLLSGTHENPE